jgi:hypothetical protein
MRFSIGAAGSHVRRPNLWNKRVPMTLPDFNEDSLVAAGEFDVQLGAPETLPVAAESPAIARFKLEKEYHGPMQGHASGEMLSAGQPQLGEATYVAIESFFGALDGRAGGFALAHRGDMHAGVDTLHISIVPGSGSGELAGIQGELKIRREAAGRYSYTLRYRIDGA